MISLDSTSKTSTPSSSLDLAPQKVPTSDSLSFANLLHGVTLKKDEKVVQNGVVILALDAKDIQAPEKEIIAKDVKRLGNENASKTDSFLSLLKSDVKSETLKTDTKKEVFEFVELNPNISKKMKPSELKVLIYDAKKYLKDKITKSTDFKQSEIKALPKTLKGLAQVAKKFGIDVNKITLEDVRPKVKTEVKEQVIELKPQPKETPLFKTQTASKEITTQQLIGTKITAKEIKSSKVQKEDETLQLLLQGKKAKKQKSTLTTDFSVATARVIAPQATTASKKTLESLLHSHTGEHSTQHKVDGFTMPQADSLDIKMHEAKQMTKYISQDVKTAIEDYKSPFTRVKVELHPQRLGSVELTVVQRGKNLHINLSSNNAAINALALNANDLKVQLNNNGINNASLNFNNNSQSADSGFSGQQQQHSQNGRDALREYGSFDKEETNEEILHSLEIIVPNYA